MVHSTKRLASVEKPKGKSSRPQPPSKPKSTERVRDSDLESDSDDSDSDCYEAGEQETAAYVYITYKGGGRVANFAHLL